MERVITLNTKRSGYAPNQCGETMTAEELISLLMQYEPNTKVYFSNDGGYTYGEITPEDIDGLDYEIE